MYQLKINSIVSCLIILSVLLINSCKKTEDESPEKATITIASPSANDMIKYGSTVNISGKIESPDGIHGYRIVIRKKSDNAVQLDTSEHAHGYSIDFNQNWTNYVQGHNDMELEVFGILGHDGSTASKKIIFHCYE